ncbi:metal-sensing transcriptional repressor [Butyricicoccus faecihominis]|uniref:metal-sensing transcriptional repressor n=1 Tax=Butyricicoccaceae TaxID=3085642 RepID=UPI00247ADFBB|nr:MULTISPECIES: metal-sensing transcriptional repressor [Butyricicoccaceae]MCQ5129532.1 metal-sensing transcriptional repressor [Butyricicoccus faecihominis]WNX83895.1 metal-sensing transcriptional repressor [Agathobaculum sp. NTUH-O15-33]
MKADKNKVEPLLRTARGQLDGVLKMIDEDRYCMDIAMQLSAVESLVHKAQREVLRAHLAGCVQEAFESGDGQARDRKIDEIIRLLEKQ